MASTISPTFVFDGNDAIIVTWAAMPNGETAIPIGPSFNDYADRSIEFSGTFGAGGSVSLKGSNVGTTYAILTDPQSTAITKTAAGFEQVIEVSRYTRPEVTAGDGTTAITATMMMRRARSARET